MFTENVLVVKQGVETNVVIKKSTTRTRSVCVEST